MPQVTTVSWGTTGADTIPEPTCAVFNRLVPRNDRQNNVLTVVCYLIHLGALIQLKEACRSGPQRTILKTSRPLKQAGHARVSRGLQSLTCRQSSPVESYGCLRPARTGTQRSNSGPDSRALEKELKHDDRPHKSLVHVLRLQLVPPCVR
jgi:hypothetical protein